MIDLKLVRDDPDRVRTSQLVRGEDPALVDALLAADEQRRAAVLRFDTVRGEQKTLGKAVASAGSDADRQALLARARDLAAEVREAEAEQSAADDVLRDAMLALSNVIEPGVPEGGEEDFALVAEVGQVPSFSFTPRDHVELGQLLGAIDVERAAKVSGSRFYYLTGVGALLELALVNMAMKQAVDAGFIPMLPPALVRPRAMEGTGFLGQAAENVFRLEADDYYLVGTAEVPLAAYHMDETLLADSLPLRYVGFSPCFRREAGTYGKDTKGIIRVHQFDKVEMFTFCAPEDAAAEHQRLLGWERQFLDALEVPYRVIDVASGDLGSSAARKYDCEAWVPTQGKYREVTSTSNCTEFQARRLNIRMRDRDGVRSAATLNGTLVAIPRTIVAILENHQQADGSVVVPAALRPFLGRDVIEPIAR
ncbi:MAG TPA: serine--tRNA ligase [Acidothermaceae bacterium]|nr:serine--tRNA ligase [Acidothermaceae bacterium]